MYVFTKHYLITVLGEIPVNHQVGLIDSEEEENAIV